MTKKILISVVAILVICTLIVQARDISSPGTSLIGHWITKSGETEYYLDGTNLLMAEKSGRIMPMTYKVLEYSEKGSWAKIGVQTNYNKGHEKTIEFLNKERTIIYETLVIDLFGEKKSFNDIWNYVDEKTKP